MKYVVAVYMTDRAYGGPEEGGWWFDYGEHVRTVRTFPNAARADAYAKRMNNVLDRTLNKGRREISSVLSEGRYSAEVHQGLAPQFYPETRPHYE